MNNGIYVGAPEPLGARLHSDGANFALWAPEATRVELCLLDGNGAHWNFDLPGFTKGVFHGFVPEVKAGQRYGFRVHGQWEPETGRRFNAAKLLIDPYARAIAGELVLHESIFGHLGNDDTVANEMDSSPYVPHSVVVDETYNWAGDVAPNIPAANTIIYEAHVAGLTKLHPDVPDHQQGTFAGMAHPSVIAHLKDLGVTTIELLPTQQFVTEVFQLARGATNYWGYNTLAFFAPHNAYSSAGEHGEQVNEFKDMVRAYHSAGLEIILDVVYNHTPEGNHLGPTLSLRGLDNSTYYHLGDDRRLYWDSSGCGNTVRASHPQTLRLIMDSLRYWVQEMHVDGFRFDLATSLTRDGLHDINFEGGFISAVGQDPVLRKVKLIAEPWDVGNNGYQVGAFPEPWSEWNDQFRDCLRDFWRGQSHGVAELGWRLTGSGDIYWDQVGGSHASVNFVTAHDGFTLHDLVSYNGKHNLNNGESNADGSDNNRSWNCGVEGATHDENIKALRRRQMRNLLSTTLLSAGIPMLLHGDEVGRTQRGNNNAYCQDNEISWQKWDFAPWQLDLRDFTKHLIALRQEHRVFQRSGYLSGEQVEFVDAPDIAWFTNTAELFTDANWQDPQTRSIGMYLAGAVSTLDGHNLVDSGFYWFLNSSPHAVDVQLPGSSYASSYRLMFDTARERDFFDQHDVPASSQHTLEAWSSALWIVTAR